MLSVKAGTKIPAAVSQDCLLGVCVLCTQADKRTLIQSVLIHGMCLFGVRAARRREYERRAFVAHKLLLLQPQQVVVVRLGSLCSSSHTAKNFAFIFDMQALVRLFLPCGSPCVRSTSACAVLLRSWRTKRSGTAFSRFVLQTPCMPFVACNELAIATKSIASVCPHAERTPWVPF